MISLGFAVGVSVGVVLCIGALALLILLGVRRYGLVLPTRLDTPPPPAEGAGFVGEEMEWDHTALNITVNPLEIEYTSEVEDEGGVGLNCGQQIILDDCGANEREEEEERKKEAPKNVDLKELEWDDSTLTY